MKTFLSYSQKYNTYKKFNNIVSEHIDTLSDIADTIDDIHPFCFSYKKLTDMGRVLKEFFLLYSDEKYNTSISFAFGFEGYISNLIGIKENILSKNLGYGILREKTNKKNKTDKGITIKKAIYPPLINENPVKNNIYIKKDAVITGPNASGKTTLLKATLLNVLLSQQIGCGYFSKDSKIRLYDTINCYINIPDTSGRDSLFQSEARRCKEIYDSVMNNIDKHHFCIFDELYSGTNPYEAEASSHSFINYLSNHKNVDFMMTTHLIKLCENINNNPNIVNYNMKTTPINKYDFKYTYILKKGISKIKGAVKVLKELDYPLDIIDSTLKYLK